jgi:hypothetical protein
MARCREGNGVWGHLVEVDLLAMLIPIYQSLGLTANGNMGMKVKVHIEVRDGITSEGTWSHISAQSRRCSCGDIRGQWDQAVGNSLNYE